MNTFDKSQKKKIKQQFKKQERELFLKNLPLPEAQLLELFSDVEANLQKNACDHTPKNARQFIEKQQIDNVDAVLTWLADHGGHCDCEILYNVTEYFDQWHKDVEPVEIPKEFKQILAKKQKINNLQTDFGFCLPTVPSPWKLTQSIEGEKTEYFLQIGKGMSVCLASLQTDVVESQIDNDDFWLSDKNSSKQFADNQLERLQIENYTVIVLKTTTTVVKIWCMPTFTSQWHLEITTERQRYKGDLKEVEKLLKAILTNG